MSYVTRAKVARAAAKAARVEGEPPVWLVLVGILLAVAPALMVAATAALVH